MTMAFRSSSCTTLPSSGVSYRRAPQVAHSICSSGTHMTQDEAIPKVNFRWTPAENGQGRRESCGGNYRFPRNPLTVVTSFNQYLVKRMGLRCSAQSYRRNRTMANLPRFADEWVLK